MGALDTEGHVAEAPRQASAIARSNSQPSSEWSTRRRDDNTKASETRTRTNSLPPVPSAGRSSTVLGSHENNPRDSQVHGSTALPPVPEKAPRTLRNTRITTLADLR